MSSKYPGIDAILSENVEISLRQLGEALGISKDTAGKVKKEWLETHTQSASKEPFKIPTLPSLPKGNLLTKSEVSEMGESFTAALESDFQTLDQYLWHRQLAVGIDTQEQPIWSNLDTEEVEKLTKIMLKWGQRNGAAAAAVRGVVDSSDYIAVASIFVPRVRNTVDIMRKTRQPRARRIQHDNQN